MSESVFGLEGLRKTDGVILLDVRSEEEYKKRHLEGAVNIPLDVLEEKADEIITDHSAVIAAYCSSGARSIEAVIILREIGFENAYCLGGVVLDA